MSTQDTQPVISAAFKRKAQAGSKDVTKTLTATLVQQVEPVVVQAKPKRTKRAVVD